MKEDTRMENVRDSYVKINKNLLYSLFIGRSISFISNKYTLGNELNLILQKEKFNINNDSIITSEMLAKCSAYFKNLVLDNIDKLPTYFLSSFNLLEEKNENHKMKRAKNRNNIVIAKKPYIKPGPSRLPIPNQYIHHESREVYGEEGNWYKVISIRSR